MLRNHNRLPWWLRQWSVCLWCRRPGSIPGWGRSPGEGNGNPLQYSRLENPIDGGAWWTAVHGVTKSWTWLSDWHFHFYFLGRATLSFCDQKVWRVHVRGVHSVSMERTLHSLLNVVLFFILTEISIVSSGAEFLLNNNFPSNYNTKQLLWLNLFIQNLEDWVKN